MYADAFTPLNFTLLVPRVAPNPLPVTVTQVETVAGPHDGEMPVIAGPVVTVTSTVSLLGTPAVHTTAGTSPLVAGTATVTLVGVQVRTVAVMPSMVTAPWAVPNPSPAIVTGWLTGDEGGVTRSTRARAVQSPRGYHPLDMPCTLMAARNACLAPPPQT